VRPVFAGEGTLQRSLSCNHFTLRSFNMKAIRRLAPWCASFALSMACGPQASVPAADSQESIVDESVAAESELNANALGFTQAAPVERHQKVLRSAIENADLTQVALPIRLGEARGKYFWYVITESSNQAIARQLGVNFSPKLAKARGTPATQKGRFVNGVLWTQATVDFAPVRNVTPGPTFFPPSAFLPGSAGQTGYSPLVELPDGTVLNASHVANGSGQSDKVVRLSTERRFVVLGLAEGFYEDQEVYYVSLDASGDLAAALEAVNFTTSLNAAPGIGSNDPATSARAGIAIFTNGQTGAANANRQGLTSALKGEGGPNNVIETFPVDENNVPELDYSPLWDAHVTEWTAANVSGGTNVVQEDFAEVQARAAEGKVTAPGGGTWGASGFIVNCPAVSIDRVIK
jgi:hypothetical protein